MTQVDVQAVTFAAVVMLAWLIGYVTGFWAGHGAD
jgi:hypothetical protein